jgi:hypothetical protein
MGYYLWAYANKLLCQYLTETIRSADANLNSRSQFWKELKWSTQSSHATRLKFENDLQIMWHLFKGVNNNMQFSSGMVNKD